MGFDLKYIDGQTPLDEDEKEGLLIPTIATRAELDEFEQQNIEDAIQWALLRPLNVDKIFTEQFIQNLHVQMYGNVWDWAGSFRRTNKNLGVDKWLIPTSLKALLDDAKYWVKNQTYASDEIAIRFKHKLVCIHCFPNGNGRHSRLMADIIADKIYKLPVYSWGANNLVQESETRTKYITAVKEADKNNYEPLLLFARS
ncbi:MAG: mobile mystery protein B [Bacteroidetes bacterium]|nr:MAG: mobile mystery protein B [Bacteroidota bacterium]